METRNSKQRGASASKPRRTIDSSDGSTPAGNRAKRQRSNVSRQSSSTVPTPPEQGVQSAPSTSDREPAGPSNAEPVGNTAHSPPPPQPSGEELHELHAHMASSGAGAGDASDEHREQEHDDAGDEAFTGSGLTAANALHHLLCKLGGSIDEAGLMTFMSGAGGAKQRFKTILSQLQTPEHEAQKLQALMELNEVLSMSTEDQLGGFPMESVVPILVQCLSCEHNPDIMLYAARALTWLADVVPASCGCIVRHDAITAFCTRLLAIQYIDVAEQSLQALEKVSAHHPEACLRQGGMMAVLSYLDFFPTNVQRSAVSTAASMAAKVSGDTMHYALEAMPTLLNLIGYSDGNINESACLALSRIATAASKDQKLLSQLAAAGLIEKGIEIIEVNDQGGIEGNLNPASFFLLLSTLKTCAAASPKISGSLMHGGLHSHLHKLLANSGTALANGAANSAVKSPQHLKLVLDFIAELLPSIPSASTLVAGNAVALLEAHAREPAMREHTEFLQKNPELLGLMCSPMLPLLYRIYGAQVDSAIRNVCVDAIIKLVFYSSNADLADSVEDVPISSFVVSLVSTNDAASAAPGVVLAELLMHKLPDMFAAHFVREGTCHALVELAELAPAAKAAPLQVRTRAMSKSPATQETPPRTLAPLEVCATRAQHLISLHFNDANRLDSEGFRQLRTIISGLKSNSGPAAFQELLTLLSNSASITAFELQRSDVFSSIIEHISAADLTGNDANCERQRLERLHTVTKLLFTPAPATADEQTPPAMHLISKLISVLEATEKFGITSTPLPTFSGANSYGRRHPPLGQMSPHQHSLYSLTQPVKLRLQRSALSPKLRDYSSATVLVEPLAKLSTVEEFLWARTRASAAQPSSSLAREAARDAMRAAAAAVAGATSSVPAGDAEKDTSTPVRRVTRSQMSARSDNPDSVGGHEPGPLEAAAAASAATAVAHQLDDGPSAMDEDDPVHDEQEFELKLDGDGNEVHTEDDDDEDGDGDGDPSDDDANAMHRHHTLPMVQDLQLPDDVSAAQSGAATPSPVTAALQAGTAWASGAGAAAAPAPRRLVFLVDGKVLSQHATVLQAVIASHESQDGTLPSTSIWDCVHALQYATPADVHEDVPEVCDTPQDTPPSTSARPLADLNTQAGTFRSIMSDISASADDTDVRDFTSSSTSQCLVLLRLLDQLMHSAGAVAQLCGTTSTTVTLPREAFHSTGVNSKLLQQLKDTVALCAGRLPAWCCVLPMRYKALFPFESRRRFFYFTAFSIGRTLNYMQQIMVQETGVADVDNNVPEMRVARLSRQKVRVSRNRVLESAMKVFSMYSSAKNVLEFEFFNEVGTGLGPTLEFYTLLAGEVQKKSLGMWRDYSVPEAGASKTVDSAATVSPASDLVYTAHGLFPRPYAPGTCPKKVLSLFDMLGKATAKCLQDNRLIDLQFAASFFRVLFGQPLVFADLKTIDPGLAASLSKIKHAISTRASNGTVYLDGCSIEDLSFSFTLPGYPDYELKPDGAELTVDSSNCQEYFDLVVGHSIGTGIQAQVDAFRTAFDIIFDMQVLECVAPDELEVMLRGQGESWSRGMLLDTIKCDHGYTKQSLPVQYLVEVLCELSPAQQATFLRFVTGSPRLPPGGLAALSPRMTIVCKRSSGDGTTEPGTGPDTRCNNDLPSVMTCANYMKLPPYSSKDVCRERLMYAIHEGQGSFDLS